MIQDSQQDGSVLSNFKEFDQFWDHAICAYFLPDFRVERKVEKKAEANMSK